MSGHAVPKEVAANSRGRSRAGKVQEPCSQLDPKGRAIKPLPRSVPGCRFPWEFSSAEPIPKRQLRFDGSSCGVSSIWENKPFIAERGAQLPPRRLKEVIHIKPVTQYTACSKDLPNGSDYSCCCCYTLFTRHCARGWRPSGDQDSAPQETQPLS